MKFFAEYMWLEDDEIKSKTKILRADHNEFDPREDLLEWFHIIDDELVVLQPGFYVADPIRKSGCICVLNETCTSEGIPTESNHRARLRKNLAGAGEIYSTMCSMSYNLKDDAGKQVSQSKAMKIAETHAAACLDADLDLDYYDVSGHPGFYEFSMDLRASLEDGGVIRSGDQLAMARYFLHRIAQANDVNVVYDGKTWTEIAVATIINDEPKSKILKENLGNSNPYLMYNKFILELKTPEAVAPKKKAKEKKGGKRDKV